MNEGGDQSLFIVVAHYFPLLDELFITTMLCSLRCMAAFLVLPAMAQQFVQGTIRAGLVIVIGSYIAFGQPVGLIHTVEVSQWIGHAVKELMIGFMMGFAASTVFWTAECVGAMIDTQAGYNSVQMTNPLSGEQATPVSNLLLQMTVSVFYILGGMTMFIGAMFESFKLWPVMASMPDASRLPEVFLAAQIQGLMTGVIKFAAPVLIILMLIDLGIGLITRAADKLEPSSLSQPIKGAVTMLMLALLMATMVNQVKHMLLPTGLLKQMKSAVTGGDEPAGGHGAGGGGGGGKH